MSITEPSSQTLNCEGAGAGSTTALGPEFKLADSRLAAPASDIHERTM